MKVLDFHAPKKDKAVKGNNAPFMSKVLCINQNSKNQ